MIAGVHQLYFGTSTSKTFVFDNSIFSDDGNSIELKVRTKNFYLSGPDQLDEIQRVFLYADEPQAANFSISIDGGDYEYQGQIQETREPQKFDVWKQCYHFSLGLDEISTNNIKIKGFNVHYNPQTQIL